MAKNPAGLAEWGLGKAQEYLESADANLAAKRLYPAAEDIFRATETTLEAMLYNKGIKRIAYPGKEKEFTGRLALQFLIRDNLVPGTISSEDYHEYHALAAKLHTGGYEHSKRFDPAELAQCLEFAEKLFDKAKNVIQ